MSALKRAQTGKQGWETAYVADAQVSLAVRTFMKCIPSNAQKTPDK